MLQPPAAAEVPVQFTGGPAQPPRDSAPAAGWKEVSSKTRYFRPSVLPFGSSTAPNAAPPMLRAELFDGERLDYSMESFTSSSQGVRSWVGSPEAEPAHPAARLIVTVTHSAEGVDLMSASVWDLDGAHIEVFLAGDGVYGMAKIDESKLAGDEDDDTLPIPSSTTSSSATSMPSSTTTTVTPTSTSTIAVNATASRRPADGRSTTGWLLLGVPLLLVGAALIRHTRRSTKRPLGAP